MQTRVCNQKLLNQLSWLALLLVVRPTDSTFLGGRKGAGPFISRDPPQVRIPHHAFSTWAKIPKVEQWLGTEAKKPQLMDSINKFRAKICWQLKDKHGEKFDSFTACKAFMTTACRPGGDFEMDGDKKELPSGKGYCKEYFPESEEKAEEELKEEEALEDAEEEEFTKDVEADDALAKGGDVAEGKHGAAPAGAPAAAGGAPSPGPSSSPAGAPSPVAYPEDEAWYYKNGGKDAGRFHMSEKMKLPTHGYHGKLVEHNDQETMASDWQAEVGNSDPASLAAVCKQHPTSKWCHGKGYRWARSGSSTLASSAVVVLLAMTASFI